MLSDYHIEQNKKKLILIEKRRRIRAYTLSLYTFMLVFFSDQIFSTWMRKKSLLYLTNKFILFPSLGLRIYMVSYAKVPIGNWYISEGIKNICILMASIGFLGWLLIKRQHPFSPLPWALICGGVFSQMLSVFLGLPNPVFDISGVFQIGISHLAIFCGLFWIFISRARLRYRL